MRTYGRVYNPDGTYTWTEVDTAADGSNDAVWLTTLIQCLKLALGESPFYANYGIPAHRSILTQIFPDFYVSQTQTQFSPYFGSLIISKQEAPYPKYLVNVTTNQGVKIQASVPV